MNVPFDTMLSWMPLMGSTWAIGLVAVMALATGMLVLATHRGIPLDAPRHTH